MAFVGGTLYVGLDDGTIKIYDYNDDPSKKNRFVVRIALLPLSAVAKHLQCKCRLP